MGIGYYYLMNYSKASEQLEKAVSFNSADTISAEYLYYSYLFTARKAEAQKCALKFNAAAKKRLGIKLFSFTPDFGGGLVWNNNAEKNARIDLDGTANKYGETERFGSIHFYYGGIQLPLQLLQTT